MGEFAQVKNKLEPSLGLSGQPVKRGTMAHEHIVYMMLVDSAANARDREAILKYAPLLEELAVRDDHQPYLAIAYRAYGVAHQIAKKYDRAERRLQQALEIFDELGLRWQHGRTLYELGELAHVRANNPLSLDLFSQALDEFESIKAMPDAERTRVALDKISNKDVS
jgi:tetratricopeptide (TPR) repeat protein